MVRQMKSTISAFDVQKDYVKTSYSRPIDEKQLEAWLDASTFYGSNFRKAFSERDRNAQDSNRKIQQKSTMAFEYSIRILMILDANIEAIVFEVCKTLNS